MKLHNTIITTLITFSIITTSSATVLNGRLNIINNDGNNFKVMLQINTNTTSSNMGGATMVINYDTTSLSFPDNPVADTDYNFNNFNLGYYDTAKVTKIYNGQLWINIDLVTDDHGTLVQKGPELWTDMVILNFTSNQIVLNDVVSWNINSKFWHVYDEDNTSSWGKGNFGSVTYAADGENSSHTLTYSLDQNYPNPFNPTTKIQYSVPERNYLKLTVFNVVGQEVAVLAEGEQEAGFYSLDFNAANLPSGVYFYRLQAGKFIETRKMILLK